MASLHTQCQIVQESICMDNPLNLGYYTQGSIYRQINSARYVTRLSNIT